MTDKAPLTDKALDDLFDLARAQAPSPSHDLVMRILSDADSHLSDASELNRDSRKGTATRLRDLFGGWPAWAGLATAAVTGIAIGFAAPEALDTWSGGYLSAAFGAGMSDLMPSFTGLIGDGAL